jgi:hypothetical protein
MREQFGQSLPLDFRGDLRNIVEDAVERRMPPVPVHVPAPAPAVEDVDEKADELQARVTELEQQLRLTETHIEAELSKRRGAEDHAADLGRRLQHAESRIEVETMNKSAFHQRFEDLEERLQQEEARVKEEILGRRAAEDRLSEVQHLRRS